MIFGRKLRVDDECGFDWMKNESLDISFVQSVEGDLSKNRFLISEEKSEEHKNVCGSVGLSS